MTDRPILFSGPMVRAILSGAKTETRRVVKPERWGYVDIVKIVADGAWWVLHAPFDDDGHGIKCPYGVPGDRLWVRETWRAEPGYVLYAADWSSLAAREPLKANAWAEKAGWVYVDGRGWRIGAEKWPFQPWRPSIHMPRWASRLTLAVESVRVERLHDIDDAGARAEGVADREAYRVLWSEINGAESWDANPWVWVVGFSRVSP